MEIQHRIIILLAMMWLHVADDYYLQGILASMKQKSWWKEKAPDSMYRHDYLAALIAHAFSWAFAVMLPVAVLIFTGPIHPNAWIALECFVFNVMIHALMDHLKANKRVINLVEDQLIHLVQVVATWTACILLV